MLIKELKFVIDSLFLCGVHGDYSVFQTFILDTFTF